MRAEKISYKYDFPLNISISEITEDPLHYHKDIEIVVVLSGEIKLKNGCCTYLLPQGSIFVNNGREVHGLYKTDSGNTIASIQISTAYFSKHFPYLSKSSFRTYAFRETDERFDKLREMLLDMLSLYLRKGIDYKQQCIDGIIDIINFLNRKFNLFSFDKNIVVSPRYDNLILIERMSRIIPYIYEHHNEKITLENLADIEHLSTFYISHMIKTCTGLNFREFLAFARVEFSEMYLLQTDEKINSIARTVGFSTTAYYEKFFKKWFGTTPTEHRIKYSDMVKNPLRPAKLLPVTTNTALSMIQQGLSLLQKRSYGLPVKQLTLYVKINATGRSLFKVSHRVKINITREQYKKTGDRIFSILKMIGCQSVKAEQGMEKEFSSHGFEVSLKDPSELQRVPVYGLDSIANLINIFKENLLFSGEMEAKLMDDGDPSVILKGDNGLLTAAGQFKPAYYAYMILSKFKGELIAHDSHHAVVRTEDEHPSYIIAVLNFNSDTFRICSTVVSMQEAHTAIENYKDELDFNVNLYGLSGKYSIKKYSFDHSDTLFDYMSRLDFPKNYHSALDFDLSYYTAPKTDVFTESISDTLHLNFSIKGMGFQMAVVEPMLL